MLNLLDECPTIRSVMFFDHFVEEHQIKRPLSEEEVAAMKKIGQRITFAAWFKSSPEHFTAQLNKISGDRSQEEPIIKTSWWTDLYYKMRYV